MIPLPLEYKVLGTRLITCHYEDKDTTILLA